MILFWIRQKHYSWSWVDFYSAYGLILVTVAHLREDGTDLADIGLNTEGAVEGMNTRQAWYEKWPEGYVRYNFSW